MNESLRNLIESPLDYYRRLADDIFVAACTVPTFFHELTHALFLFLGNIEVARFTVIGDKGEVMHYDSSHTNGYKKFMALATCFSPLLLMPIHVYGALTCNLLLVYASASFLPSQGDLHTYEQLKKSFYEA